MDDNGVEIMCRLRRMKDAHEEWALNHLMDQALAEGEPIYREIMAELGETEEI